MEMACTAYTEDALERYAMGLSEKSDLERIEEHLLVCGDCRETVAFVDAITDASRAIRGKRQVLSLRAH